MSYSKVGLYTIGIGTINYFSANRTSLENFFAYIEYVATESGAWDYVPCARSESPYWAMLVSKSVDVNGFISVVEFVHNTTYSYVEVHNYSRVPSSKGSQILSANSRSDITNLGLVRNSTSSIHPDLCNLSGWSTGLWYTYITATTGAYWVYIGPEVIFVGRSGTLNSTNSNSYSINYFILKRQGISGNFLCTGIVGVYSPYGSSYASTQTTPRTSYGFQVIHLHPLGKYTSLEQYLSNMYSTNYIVYPDTNIVYPIYQPKIAMNNGNDIQVVPLDFCIIAHTSYPENTITYNNKEYKFVFTPVRSVDSSYAGNVKVFLIIDKDLR